MTKPQRIGEILPKVMLDIRTRIGRQMPGYWYYGIQPSRISPGPGSPVVHVEVGPSIESAAEARAVSRTISLMLVLYYKRLKRYFPGM